MKIKLGQLLLYLILLMGVIQIVSCKKEPAQGITATPPPPLPPPLPTTFGSVSFWANLHVLYFDDEYIMVTINNVTKYLDTLWSYGSSPSNCTDLLTIRFDLPAGTYSWKASNNYGKAVTGTITIPGQYCRLQQIKF